MCVCACVCVCVCVCVQYLGAETEEKNALGGIGMNERIILKWSGNKSDGRLWTGLIRLRIRISDGNL